MRDRHGATDRQDTALAAESLRTAWRDVPEILWEELRHATRRLRLSPGFSLAAIVTLGLAIGLNTAIFSVTNAVWLRPLPVTDSARLVAIERPYRQIVSPVPLWGSVPDYLDWRDRNPGFVGLAMARIERYDVVTAVAVHASTAFEVSANLFDVLGVKPYLGRTFRPDEDQPGHAKVVMVSERMWRTTFGGDRALVGRRISLRNWDGVREDHEVVGVLPAGFELEYESEVGLFVPYRDWPVNRSNRLHGGVANRVYARLPPDMSLEQAHARMAALCATLQKDYPNDPRGDAVRVVGFHEHLLGKTRPAVVMLTAAVGLVLLIGCSNVAVLLLARCVARRHGNAIRAALGATRARLVLAPLVESVLVAALGGLIGLILANWSVDLLLTIAPPELDRITEVRLDAAVLGFAAMVSLVAGVAVGLVPSWRGSRGDLGSLRVSNERGGQGLGRWRAGFVLIQVVPVVVLLVAGGLLARTVYQMVHLDMGFDPRQVLTAWLVVPGPVADSPAKRAALERDAVERLRAVPGVTCVTAASSYPLSGGTLSKTRMPDGTTNEAVVASVGRDFFALLQLPLVRGRLFEVGSGEDQTVALVNEQFVRQYFRGQDAIGQVITIKERPRQIVGVVGDTTEIGTTVGTWRWRGLGASTLPWAYLPQGQTSSGTILLKVAGDAAAMTEPIRSAVRSLGRELDVEVRALETRVARRTADSRFYATAIGVVAGMALLLATVGLYGIVGQSVEMRQREMAIRLALGATPGRVRRGVMQEALTVAAVGIAVGSALAAAAAQSVRHFLFGVGPLDPVVFAGAVAVLAAAAAAAAYLPAWRATRFDVVHTLRSE